MPTHNGSVLPLFKILKWNGLHFKNGKVLDSAESATNMSKALLYGTKTEAQQVENVRAQRIPKHLRIIRPIIDQIDGRIYELIAVVREKQSIIAEHGWPTFWEHVLGARK